MVLVYSLLCWLEVVGFPMERPFARSQRHLPANSWQRSGVLLPLKSLQRAKSSNNQTTSEVTPNLADIAPAVS